MVIKEIRYEEQESIRIDRFLARELCDISRSQIQKWIETGSVLVNGDISNKKYLLNYGDIIKVEEVAPVCSEILPQAIPLDIIYEDSDLLVVNKPRGMVVHPAPGNYEGTLVNALLDYCKGELSGIGGVIRPGIVHRIDKDTSGLLMVAKNDFAHQGLSEQIAGHHFFRQYQTIVHGLMKEIEGTIDKPIGRSHRDRKKMAVIPDGKPSITHYQLQKQYVNYACLAVQLETGRTHQIRVHMRSVNHPIAGDPIYGVTNFSKAEKELKGQWLHAESIGFIHPRSGKELFFSAPIPKELEEFVKKIDR